MSTFLITWILAIIFAIISIICFTVAFFREKSKYSAIAGLASAIVSFILLFNIDISKPIIEPLDNEIKTYETDVNVTISSEVPNYFTIYYSIDGTDPKYGNLYKDTIALSESTTVCARNKFLWMWSDIAKTSYIIKKDVLISDDDTFVPDYASGKENVNSDSTYRNNQGFFSKQDQMYYFATSTGIYKINSSFEKCELIVDDIYAIHLNVLGDWIYYSSFDGIYKIRTDGKYKTRIVQLEEIPLDMSVHNKTIYCIKPDDAKLYSNDLNGQNEKCLYNKTVCKFICIDLYIYFVEAEVTKKDNIILSYRTTALKKMFYDGSDIQNIFETEYDNDGELLNDAPSNLCAYKDYVVCSNSFSLFLINRYSNDIKKINNQGGYGLCVYNDCAYYSTVKPTVNGYLTKVSLDTYESDTFAKPLNDDSVQLLCIYPVEDKVILMVEREKWYYLDINNELIRIKFDVT